MKKWEATMQARGDKEVRLVFITDATNDSFQRVFMGV